MTIDKRPPNTRSEASCDVVVIGSGFGGSISANRLSLSGLNVLVLERGRGATLYRCARSGSHSAPLFHMASGSPHISSAVSTSARATHPEPSSVLTQNNCELVVSACCGASSGPAAEAYWSTSTACTNCSAIPELTLSASRPWAAAATAGWACSSSLATRRIGRIGTPICAPNTSPGTTRRSGRTCAQLA